jgi:hypothetical protein
MEIRCEKGDGGEVDKAADTGKPPPEGSQTDDGVLLPWREDRVWLGISISWGGSCGL